MIEWGIGRMEYRGKLRNVSVSMELKINPSYYIIPVPENRVHKYILCRMAFSNHKFKILKTSGYPTLEAAKAAAELTI